jgi:hypothetical protein
MRTSEHNVYGKRLLRELEIERDRNKLLTARIEQAEELMRLILDTPMMAWDYAKIFLEGKK